MAFDGITIAAMVRELHLNLDGGRFNKIAQPEADELLIFFRLHGLSVHGKCRHSGVSLPKLFVWTAYYFSFLYPSFH